MVILINPLWKNWETNYPINIIHNGDMYLRDVFYMICNTDGFQCSNTIFILLCFVLHYIHIFYMWRLDCILLCGVGWGVGGVCDTWGLWADTSCIPCVILSSVSPWNHNTNVCTWNTFISNSQRIPCILYQLP